MPDINSVQQIVATIRAEMTARINVADTHARPTQTRQANSKTVRRSAMQRHGSLINQRVTALDPDDPNRGRKSFRIFLESVLLVEFGEALINDPQFYQMVDEVQRTMEADPQIADAIDRAISSLLGSQIGDAG